MGQRQVDNSSAIVDNFKRETLGSTWAIYNGDVGIINQCELGILSKSPENIGLGVATWSGTQLAADQYCEVTLSPNVDDKALLEVFVRRRKSDKARYGFYCMRLDNASQPAASYVWGFKLDGIVPGIVLASTDGPRLLAGDTIRIEVMGNLIKGFYNGEELLSVIDSLLTEPGEPGVAMAFRLVESFPSPFFSSWQCGNLE